MEPDDVTFDAYARNVYNAVPEFLSLDEADRAIVKEARARYFDAPKAQAIADVAAKNAEAVTNQPRQHPPIEWACSVCGATWKASASRYPQTVECAACGTKHRLPATPA